MKRLTLMVSLIGVAALATPADAQGRGRGNGGGQERGADSIPSQYRPPAGMCRIWINGVRPNQQPAPTDCASAVRNRPPNGRVIFGPELPKPKTQPTPKNPETTPQKGEPPRIPPQIPVPIPGRKIPPV